MSKILQPTTKFKKNLEYEVKRYGNLYITKVHNAHFDMCGYSDIDIIADLSLLKVEGKKQSLVWAPKITNFLNTGRKEIYKGFDEFYIQQIRLNCWDSFKGFVKEINMGLYKDYKKKISYDDAEAFFLQAHEHYRQITDSISK